MAWASLEVAFGQHRNAPQQYRTPLWGTREPPVLFQTAEFSFCYSACPVRPCIASLLPWVTLATRLFPIVSKLVSTCCGRLPLSGQFISLTVSLHSISQCYHGSRSCLDECFTSQTRSYSTRPCAQSPARLSFRMVLFTADSQRRRRWL